MPRFCSVSLPELRVEIARASCEGERGPLALVVARPGGAVQTETDLLGNTRLDEVEGEARAWGIRAGQTIAAARAKRADLRVRVVPMGAVRGALARLCEVLLAFGATTAFDDDDDVVWIDVTGCAHLHGGERALAERVSARVVEIGHRCRAAIADGPRIAAMVAKHGPGDVAVVPAGKSAAAMRRMPLRALPLDDETKRWLARVGMRTLGDLQKLPRESLALRLGAEAPRAMALLDGDDRAPLAPYRPPETIEERADLEYGIESIEALLFVAKGLCDRTAARLEGRALAAARVELAIALDRAMVPEGEDARVALSIALPVPLARADALFAVLRAKLEGFALAAPALAVTLRAAPLVRLEGRALDLFVAEAKAEAAVPRLVAELVAELGDGRVGVLDLADTWVTDARTRLAPFRGLARTKPRGAEGDVSRRVSLAPEPSRLLQVPVPLTAPIVGGKLIARFEHVEWWRGGRASRARDRVAAWIAPGGLACVEVDRETGEARLDGWMD